MWKLYSILVAGILLVFTWTCVELRVFDSTSANAAANVANDAVENKQARDGVRKALELREKQLISREEVVARKQRELEDKEKVLTQQISRYEKIIREMTGQVSELETLRADKAESFRSVFEKMEAKKASKILETMETKLAASVVGGLKRDRAGEILSSMAPDKAKAIAELVLGRRGLSSAQRDQPQSTQASTATESAPEKGGDR